MLWDGDYFGCGGGISFYGNSFPPNKTRGGVGAEKLCIYFYYPKQEKRNFYIATHMICRLSHSLFHLYTVWARRRGGKSVNEPSADGDGILLLFLQYTHDGCLLCVLVNNLLNHVIPHARFWSVFTASWGAYISTNKDYAGVNYDDELSLAPSCSLSSHVSLVDNEEISPNGF